MRYYPGGTLRHGADAMTAASPPAANARTVASISSRGIASTHAKRRKNAHGFSIDELGSRCTSMSGLDTTRVKSRSARPFVLRVRTVLTGVFNAFSKVQPLLSRLKTM
jgi:hypothetical protein